MRNKDENQKTNQRVEAVLELLKKQAPLTAKQEKFCSNACIERFLKSKGESVKKAAKQLRACLSWRESIGVENMIADEFSTALGEGAAYVAGHDEESRPVIVFRIKQDYQKFHSQKMFTRLLVFTLEVAIQTMPPNVEQFVLLFDGNFFRSAPALLNILLAALKVTAEHYPGRLHRSFIIDPPSLFSYIWKGVRPFVELSPLTIGVSLLDVEESLELNDFASSQRFNPSSASSTARIGPCASSRFSFTVAHHSDSLKPWYLTFTDTSASKVGPTSTSSASPSPSQSGPALICPLNARSVSFASPATRMPRGDTNGVKKRFSPARKPQKVDPTHSDGQRPPLPSFLPSPSTLFRRENPVGKIDKSRESFGPFVKFYRQPYDEMNYRSKMRPPLGGPYVVSPLLRSGHASVSQRFSSEMVHYRPGPCQRPGLYVAPKVN